MKIAFSCLLLLSAALAGCQRAPQDPEPVPEATPATPATPATAADPRSEVGREMGPGRLDIAQPKRDTTPVDAKVVNIRLSNQGDSEENTLGMPTTTFKPTDTVYAEIESTGSAAGYTIYAKWIAADGTVLSDYGMHVGEAGLKRTVISLSKPDGWPSGNNSIEIAINGEKQQTATFQVR